MVRYTVRVQFVESLYGIKLKWIRGLAQVLPLAPIVSLHKMGIAQSFPFVCKFLDFVDCFSMLEKGERPPKTMANMYTCSDEKRLHCVGEGELHVKYCNPLYF
jgi:hypothetical protein